MINDTLIPDIDPIALPAPLWLLKSLLLFTFTLHIIAMNFAVGGGFIAAVSEFIGRKKKSQNHLELSRSISKMLPVMLAFTINLGVAPLLFLQVLYGQFFYTSTILIAWPWLSVVLLVILAYYGYYVYSFKWEKIISKRAWLILICSILLATVGMIYVSNIVLMLTPDKWRDMYFSNPHGIHLNFADTTWLPRYLHFMLAALAIAGFIVLMWGIKKQKTDKELGNWAIRYGGWWFIIPTLINIAVGLWFLFAIPDGLLIMFFVKNIYATSYLLISIVAMFISIGLILAGMYSTKSVMKIILGKIFLVLTIVMMVLMRHELRESYLKQYVNWDAVIIEPQWDVIMIFALLLVGGLITIGWMLKKALGKSLGSPVVSIDK